MPAKTWFFALTTVFLLAPAACDPGESSAPADEAERGHVGKADLIGSCENACGGPSDGNCWCDELCTDFGDCCDDFEQACSEPSACAGDNPAGCVETGCGAGEVCSTQTEACISSACFCDEASGTWLCTADCSGGQCVPEPDPEPMECEGDNPAGCVTTGCAQGEVCSTETQDCIASACSCEESTGLWLCTADCGGGQCVPETVEDACEGPNPADMCSDDPDACIPSGCSCDEVTGVWTCTPDCSGGTAC